jgi:hypothetical protein
VNPVTQARAEDPVTEGDPVKRKAQELRKKYPFETMAGRLEYEADRAAGLAREGKEARLTQATAQRLEKLEKSFSIYLGGNVRIRSLQMLHSEQVEDFIKTDGMGVSRMMLPPSPKFLELPDAPAVALPEIGSAGADEEAGEVVALPKQSPRQPIRGSGLPSLDLLATFHDGGLFNFLDPRGFGYIVNRDQVAGFRSHQFRSMPGLPQPPVRGQKAVKEKERWMVRRLELVSLLKHEEPAVYVSEHLPRMDALQKAVTRPLTDFESEALKALREGEDLVTRATTEQIRMVGSVRAGKQCLSCHSVKRGELLGAFSYKLGLSPVNAAAK